MLLLVLAHLNLVQHMGTYITTTCVVHWMHLLIHLGLMVLCIDHLLLLVLYGPITNSSFLCFVCVRKARPSVACSLARNLGIIRVLTLLAHDKYFVLECILHHCVKVLECCLLTLISLVIKSIFATWFLL